tara:strand:- start:207 stop:767 length:561 start_codon:yes stop_codon:yes gene_type:complete
MMDERKEFEELKRMLKEQGDQVAETMATMKVKASALEEKLAKRAELSSANAEAGAKKIALEYKVVELEIRHDFPPGMPNETLQHQDFFSPNNEIYKEWLANVKAKFVRNEGLGPEHTPFPLVIATGVPHAAVIKECEGKPLKTYREFEETKLKELGEEGWTLRSIAREGISGGGGYTNLYYFSRPL